MRAWLKSIWPITGINYLFQKIRLLIHNSLHNSWFTIDPMTTPVLSEALFHLLFWLSRKNPLDKRTNCSSQPYQVSLIGRSVNRTVTTINICQRPQTSRISTQRRNPTHPPSLFGTQHLTRFVRALYHRETKSLYGTVQPCPPVD